MNIDFDPVEPWNYSWQFLTSTGSAALFTALVGALALTALLALPLVLWLSPPAQRPKRLRIGVIVTCALVAFLALRGGGQIFSLSAILDSTIGVLLILLPLIPFLLIVLTLWTYADSPGADGRRVWALVALRLLAFALVLGAMFRPVFFFADPQDAKTRLQIAIDASDSMNILDEFNNQSRWAYLQTLLRESGPSLQRLRDKGVEITFVRFAGDVGPFDPEKPGKADGKRTDIGNLLYRLYEDRDLGRAPLGLLVLSDGADNANNKDHPALNEAEKWRGLPCPVHTFGFGKTTTKDVNKNVAIRDIVLPGDTVPIKSELAVKVRVDAVGFRGAPARLKLFIDDKEMKAEDVILAEEADNVFEIKTIAPAKPGEVKITVKIEDPRRPGEPLPGQVSRLKNELSTYLTLTKDGISVLLVDKQRAWEPIAICDALAQEPRIRVTPVWVRSDKPSDNAPDLFQFEKQQYDVILLGDVTMAQLRAINKDAPEAIERQVNDKAGLLMIGGYASFANGDWGQRTGKDQPTALEKLLPTMMDKRGQIEGERRMIPTDAGLRRFGYFLGLAGTDKETKEIWEKLAPLDGMCRLGTPIPTASVLAESKEHEPFLVARDYGGGRVLAFAGDTTYLWKSNPEGVAAHKRFWQRMVIWLAHQDEGDSQAWVKPGTRRVALTDNLNMTFGLRNKQGKEIANGEYKVEVIGPQGTTPVTPKKLGSEESGTFEHAPLPGEYRIVVKGTGTGPDGEKVAGDASARFLVYDDDSEQTRRAADHEFLRKLAAAGGGQFQRAEKLTEFLDKLLAQAEQRKKEKPKGRGLPDWRGTEPALFPVLYFVLFTALVCSEWFLKRRWGWV